MLKNLKVTTCLHAGLALLCLQLIIGCVLARVEASEVHRLAQHTARAVKESKNLFFNTAEKVEGGTRLVCQDGAETNEVVQIIQRVATLIHEIVEASQEQSSGIARSGEAARRMDELMQQNASTAARARAAPTTVREQMALLNASVSASDLLDKAASHIAHHASSEAFQQQGKHDFLGAG